MRKRGRVFSYGLHTHLREYPSALPRDDFNVSLIFFYNTPLFGILLIPLVLKMGP
jgi:hypothetical protein